MADLQERGQSDGAGNGETSPLTPVACRYCGAPVIWTWTGKAYMPIDPRPHPEGRWELQPYLGGRAPRVVYFGARTRADLYNSHFATCPKADVARSIAKEKRRGR